MDLLKDQQNTISPISEDKKEKDEKQRNDLIEEAIMLSKEANVTIDSNIRQYTRYQLRILERSRSTDSDSNVSSSF